ncbi:MAG TPA: hypothetical protein VEL31_29065 [Ktedonobacteraceae bacterium]|nr:hypothetical protein [Ktedonobacteraceae bacterium]
MDMLNESLFLTSTPRELGAGFHNIGSGVLRGSNKAMIDKLEAHYGERCGHVPLDARRIRVLVDTPTPDIDAQVAYLSQLFGKDLKAITFEDLKAEQEALSVEHVLVVPYINVPEAEQRIRGAVDGTSWGMPGSMVHLLKNKADFYRFADELELDGVGTPDYKISNIYDIITDAVAFLADIEDIYKKAGMAQKYPPGIVFRTAESDGNYGSCLVYERGGAIIVLPDGDADDTQSYTNWRDAIVASQKSLLATMNVQKEQRVVISRYIDIADSPGMSVVILDGRVESLRWNGQLQGQDSKACVGTSSYIPRTSYLRQIQQQYEDRTTIFFETLLRQAARKCSIDFATIRGIANIDIIIAGPHEKELQKRRKQRPVHYLAECNPRWTNYTDAIMTIIGVDRKEPTVNNMRTVIRDSIFTIDKSYLPANVDPRTVREYIYKIDDILKQDGTRIICRMAKNPMGLIFAGNVKRAQEEFNSVVAMLADR